MTLLIENTSTTDFIKSIQEQQTQIGQLKPENNVLRKRIETLENI